MALADYTPERYTVEWRGRVLVEVRGLSLEDVTVLVRQHLPELKELYARFQGDPKKLLPEGLDAERIALNCITEAPTLAARIICLASDERDMDAARRLTMPLQMKILIEVIRLTFEDVGGPLEFAGMLRKIVMTMPNGLPALSPPPNGLAPSSTIQ